MSNRVTGSYRIDSRTDPSGMTLLEVLVACGVLMFALAGIAAILPAASSLLVTASAEDRATAAAVNAYSELLARGIVASSSFPDLAGTSAQFSGALVLPGPLEAALEAAAAAGGAGSGLILPLFQSYDYRAAWPDPRQRGMFSEDDVRFAADSLGVPKSRFASMAGGAGSTPSGSREFRRGPSWGAMILSHSLLAPTVANPNPKPAAGSTALLSIASFQKVGEQASPDDGVVFRMENRNSFFFIEGAPQSYLSMYLKPGSWLLLLPPPPLPSPPPVPRWIRVNSAWWTPAGVFVTFGESDQQLSSYIANHTLYGVGFKNLLKVDLFSVMLR